MWRAYYEFQTALSRYEYAKALLAASQESYDANLDTYRQGLSTIVELLTADRDLANARYTIVQSRADLLTSSAAVAYAVGAIEMPRVRNARVTMSAFSTTSIRCMQSRGCFA